MQVRSMDKQGISDDVSAILNAPKQQRLTVGHFLVGIRTVMQQCLGDGDIAMQSCRRQWAAAMDLGIRRLKAFAFL